MNRRDAIAGLGMITLAGTALAQPKKAPEPKPAPKVDARAALLASLQTCLAKAAACEAHCAAQLATGNKEFARCAQTVADTLAVGWATQSVVSRKSPTAKKVVEAFAATCKDCSAACLEHKPHFAHGMHMECKECMDACDACIKACAAFLAA
jgi:Cys-rich four helix bundle protein (predicted Tat secretion target)